MTLEAKNESVCKEVRFPCRTLSNISVVKKPVYFYKQTGPSWISREDALGAPDWICAFSAKQKL